MLECDWAPKPSHVEGVKKLEVAWIPLKDLTASACKEKSMRCEEKQGPESWKRGS